MEIDRHKTSVRDVVRNARETSDKAARDALAAQTAPPVATKEAVGAVVTTANATDLTPAGKAAAIDKATRSLSTKGAPLDNAVAALDRGIIHGFGAKAGNLDLDNETLRRDALVTMAHNFTAAKARNFKVNHGEKALPKAELVESVVGIPLVDEGGTIRRATESEDVGDLVAKGAKFVGMDVGESSIGKETHWYVGFKPNDDAVLDDARKGGSNGFSWAGFCDRTEDAA